MKIKSKKFEVENCIRLKNETYNADFINANGFVGSEAIKSSFLDVSETNKCDANDFMVVWLLNIVRLCEMFNRHFKFDDYSFVDLGCGNGIATFFVSQNYDFNSFNGVDFSPKLINFAHSNRKIASENGHNVELVNFELRDAKSLILPEKPHVIFMFNPFGMTTMTRFFQNNFKNLSKTESLIFYANDVHLTEMHEWTTVIERDDFYKLSLAKFNK